MSSRYGSNINIEVFGESHSREIGVVMRNYPTGGLQEKKEALSEVPRLPVETRRIG